ncbi:3-phosphoshikimate 1-carboxyvinyltransferase [Pseudobutyrivibrio sp. ACV-2]|uniref:3-phosphoshikimate 1-carboxyvinyltransferase n=1 Tax=Pseudobutyrivibrio sp. ACV-2 TaxID=1520801 RepID=UPI00089815EF|nr:3-phosphoshikimate 1-carboxyvinyltransferase [Pseudobutyrivibrio sp. ACV-2]SDZ79682.1 3-phosphoshikimate 1-carboxyvinyltransferase [Pseudobutyrivibrio sp. ACV-2]
MAITKVKSLKGEINIPGDKSISHRGVMFGSISDGITELTGFLDGADCRSTIGCFRAMGIDISQKNDHVIIHGKGLHGLTAPTQMLDVGNSGTTTRLISGILAGQSFISSLNGDDSIQKRPMKRIITPLTMMSANIRSIRDNGCAPLEIGGAPLKPIHYDSPVASAQVKSCILLAGLYADGITSVSEPVVSRNHTELMLSGFGADIKSEGLTASIVGGPKLVGQKIEVPGDISSAAYFIAAGLICPNADILIKNVNTNPTRAGIIKIAQDMGGNIELLNERIVSGEPVADIHITTSELHGCTVSGDIIPTLIDEIPVIAVMAACAKGQTVIKDAAELKVKESDRIATVTENLKNMGCDIEATDDGMIINGGNPLNGNIVNTYLDHRIAMSFAIAGLVADGETTFDNEACCSISYPTFFETLNQIINK